MTLYTHGEVTDRLVRGGDLKTLGHAMELIKAAGVPAGIGSHSLETPIASEKHGLEPDYYVKTFHPDNYWSATPKGHREEWCWYNPRGQDHDGYNDNMFCIDPGADRGVHEVGHQALGGLQGDGRGRDPGPRSASTSRSSAAPISSSPACSTSRSPPMSSSPSKPFATPRSATGPGGREERPSPSTDSNCLR